MAHRHVLSPADHGIAECVDCDKTVPIPTVALPQCGRPGCNEDGAALAPDGTPTCLWHDPRVDLTARSRGAA